MYKELIDDLEILAGAYTAGEGNRITGAIVGAAVGAVSSFGIFSGARGTFTCRPSKK